jgi:hypothetical protein
MAFPQISDADTKSGTVIANSTIWTITYPTNVAAGDLLLLFIGADGTTDFSATGFTALAASQLSAVSVLLLGKVAVGTEAGTFIVTATAAEQGGWRIFRIPAASWFGGALTTGIGGSNESNGLSCTGDGATSSNPNPALLNPANWDVEDTLWIAAIGVDTSRTISVFPLAGRNTADVSGGAGGATLGLCSTTSTVASLDPGTFTISASDDWVSLTVAVRPAAVASVFIPRSPQIQPLLAQ